MVIATIIVIVRITVTMAMETATLITEATATTAIPMAMATISLSLMPRMTPSLSPRKKIKTQMTGKLQRPPPRNITRPKQNQTQRKAMVDLQVLQEDLQVV